MQDFISYNKAVEANNLAIVANKNSRPYKSNTDFEMGDLTIYDDKIYQALSSFKSAISFDDTKWKLLADVGGGIEVVDTLPTENISSVKIYILTDFSMNYYDSGWHKLGSDQIVIGTINTDTTKLWLDINSPTSPVLKWYNGTSWINVSSTQIQSDWNQTDNTKIDYVKNKPTNLLTANNIKQGTNVSLITNGNDVTINVMVVMQQV